mgnify:CR=1 FL=1
MIIDSRKYNGKCSCGRNHAMETEMCIVESGCLENLEKYMGEYNLTGFTVAVYDENTYNIDDQYVFCDDMIVAPLTEQSDTRMVYLPKGEWVDYWTGQKVNSGWFEVTTDSIPVYRKEV